MGDKLHPILEAMVPLLDGIANTMGKNCEAVLHEITESKKCIVAISNGHVTGRSIGSPMLDIVTQALGDQNKDKVDNVVNYSNKSVNGKILKSSTMFIRDEKNIIIGALCINIDISEFVVAHKVLDEFIQSDSKREVGSNSFPNNINDVLISVVGDTLESYGKPIAYMNKDEKVIIVKKLDEQGAFLIKGAIDYVAKILCVSRYTIYNYLDEIRMDH